MVFEIQSFMLCPSQKNALFPLEAEENYYLKTDSLTAEVQISQSGIAASYQSTNE